MVNDGDWLGGDIFIRPEDSLQYGGALELGDVSQHVTIIPDGTRRSTKFGLTFDRYKVTVKDLVNVPISHCAQAIYLILEHLLDSVLADIAPTQFVRLCLESSSLKLKIPIWTPPTLRSQVTVERWMAEVEKVLNSQEEFPLDESFHVTVECAKPPTGGCLKDVPEMLYKKLASKRCVTRVQNADNICMARALIIGKAYVDGDLVQYTSLYQNSKRNVMQTAAARKLVAEAGLTERTFGIADIPAFENVG